MTKKRIAILGSTGSIGTQALEVIDEHPDLFEVEIITANNSAQLLIQQALKYDPNIVVIANKDKYAEVMEALSNTDVKVFAGSEAIEQVVGIDSVDLVLAAMVGFAGLLPVIKAIEAKKPIALANKETLVVAGDYISRLCLENNVPMFPVDSEHSAIFQCLSGEGENQIEKIILTCSGGPFHAFEAEELQVVTPKQALKHPNWDMGAKITIDSATLMNKGFEAIEAKWLFDLSPDQIEVVVHPQSIVHSLVQFTDGSIKAQMGLPDMKLPIQYAMTYPQRVQNKFERFNFLDYPTLTFDRPDQEKFRNLAIAFEAMRMGGNVACIVNAANEVAVESFLQEKIGFTKMPDLIEETIQKVSFIKTPSISELLETDDEARVIAYEIINSNKYKQ